MNFVNCLAFLLALFRTGSSYVNPVIDSNNPDPSAIALPEGGYLAVSTSNHVTNTGSADAFPIYYSDDLVTWELRGHVFPAGTWPVWCNKNMWAPEIHLVNGRFLAYFSCSAPNSRHSIGVAETPSGDPFGPYVDAIGVPLIYHNEDSVVGVIDQHYFKDPKTNQDYMIWKTDKLLPFSTSVAFIQELEENGIAMVEGSSPTKIIETDRLDENGIVEGMWMMFQDDTYFLFFSVSNFQLATYRMMVARSSDIMGPYVKCDVPVVQTDWDRYDNGVNSTFAGPGHGSVVTDAAGDWWLIYHSWRYGQLNTQEPGRVMLLDKLEWHGAPQVELWPRVVNGGIPSDTLMQEPAV